MSVKLISVKEYAERHGLFHSTVRQKCQRGNIPGAIKVGRIWCIPEDAPYEDHRVVSGKYTGAKRNKKNK